MANFSLNFGESDTDVLAGSISFSREGQFGRVQLFSDRKDIETTVSDDGTLTDSLPLQKYYNDSLEAGWSKELSLKETKYNDVFVRFVVDPGATKWHTIDGVGGESPRGYRSFKEQLIKLSTDNDEQSPYGFVNADGSEWKRLKESGFTLTVEANTPVSYCRFDAPGATIQTFKDDEKVITIGLKGFTRLLVASTQTIPLLSTTDFSPFTCIFRDIYKHQEATDSYRKSPDEAVTDGVGQDDTTPMETWAGTTAERLRQANTSLNLLIDGDFEIDDGGTDRPLIPGDILTTLVSKVTVIGASADETLTLNLPVLSVQYDPQSDNTSITVGRA